MSEVKAQNSISMTSVKAIKDASDEATTLLDGMRQSAIDAGTTLNGIYQVATDAEASAESAQASADSASEYASRALGNLASVQSVTETLNWITAHGTMTLTTDTALDPSHVYFVVDANGDYYVGGTYYSVVSEPVLADIGSYYELSINESLNNYVATHLVVDTEGLWIIPDAGGNKVLIATGQGSTYTSAGTYIVGASAVLAKFTADGSVIGVDDGTQAYLFQDYHSFQMINADGNTYFWVSDPRDREGYFIETFIGDGSTTVFKINNTTDGGLVTVKINDVEVTNYTHVGSSNIFTFDEAPSINDVITIRYHASWTGASYGFTYGKRADNSYIGNGSAVFAGFECVASGALAIASGSNSKATGPTSFARGRYAKAGGLYSHAEGDSVQTQRKCQTVIGEYNIIDTDVTGPSSSYGNIGRRGKYVLIIGNGMLPPGGEPYRSNALTVDWDGNVVASGDVTDGNGITLSSLYHNGIIVVSSATFTSLPQTITYADITSEHVAVNWMLTNPSAQTGDWTVTTSNGSVTIDGTISGSTAITLYLAPTNTADKNGVLVVSDTITSLPKTITNADISVNHVLLNSVLSVPSLQTDDWTVTTSDGSVTITGTMASGSTDITLYLGNQTA